MLRKIKEFEYFEPSTLSEAISLLAQYGGKAKILAGGTDLLIQMKQRSLTPKYLIDIKNISELDYINYKEDNGLKIGALVTHNSLANSAVIQEKFSLLVEASLAIGTVQTRNRGTVVGNICNSSPSADTPPALIALGASFKLKSITEERIVKAEDFFLSPFNNILKETELLTEIQVPNSPVHSAGTYLWLPKITSVDETLVGVGVLISVNDWEDILSQYCISRFLSLNRRKINIFKIYFNIILFEFL